MHTYTFLLTGIIGAIIGLLGHIGYDYKKRRDNVKATKELMSKNIIFHYKIIKTIEFELNKLEKFMEENQTNLLAQQKNKTSQDDKKGSQDDKKGSQGNKEVSQDDKEENHDNREIFSFNAYENLNSAIYDSFDKKEIYKAFGTQIQYVHNYYNALNIIVAQYLPYIICKDFYGKMLKVRILNNDELILLKGAIENARDSIKVLTNARNKALDLDRKTIRKEKRKIIIENIYYHYIIEHDIKNELRKYREDIKKHFRSSDSNIKKLKSYDNYNCDIHGFFSKNEMIYLLGNSKIIDEYCNEIKSLHNNIKNINEYREKYKLMTSNFSGRFRLLVRRIEKLNSNLNKLESLREKILTEEEKGEMYHNFVESCKEVNIF